MLGGRFFWPNSLFLLTESRYNRWFGALVANDFADSKIYSYLCMNVAMFGHYRRNVQT